MLPLFSIPDNMLQLCSFSNVVLASLCGLPRTLHLLRVYKQPITLPLLFLSSLPQWPLLMFGIANTWPVHDTFVPFAAVKKLFSVGIRLQACISFHGWNDNLIGTCSLDFFTILSTNRRPYTRTDYIHIWIQIKGAIFGLDQVTGRIIQSMQAALVQD